MVATVRRVCRNVERWRSASMDLRWTAAAMQEAAKGFRRVRAREHHKRRQRAQLRYLKKAHRRNLSAKSHFGPFL
jgi:hypothetical protein